MALENWREREYGSDSDYADSTTQVGFYCIDGKVFPVYEHYRNAWDNALRKMNESRTRYIKAVVRVREEEGGYLEYVDLPGDNETTFDLTNNLNWYAAIKWAYDAAGLSKYFLYEHKFSSFWLAGYLCNESGEPLEPLTELPSVTVFKRLCHGVYQVPGSVYLWGWDRQGQLICINTATGEMAVRGSDKEWKCSYAAWKAEGEVPELLQNHLKEAEDFWKKNGCY